MVINETRQTEEMSSKTSDAEGDSVTAADYLQKQMNLEKEAREVMPFDTDECTYIKGDLRQNIYACLTCSKQNNAKIGVCYSCSIECHSTHDLVELFSRRNVVCDCGTTKMSKTPNGGCKLRINNRNDDSAERRPSFRPRTGSSAASSFGNNGLRSTRTLELAAEDIPSSSNIYNQNYDGKFCSCEKLYNPLEETATMHQCFFGDVCGEDWYHEDCVLGFAPGYIVDQKRQKALSSSLGKNSVESGTNLLDNLTPPDTGEDALSETQKKLQLGTRADHGTHEKAEQEHETPDDHSEEYDDDMDDDDIEDAKILGNYFPRTGQFDQFICWKCVGKYKKVFEQLAKDPQITFKSMPHFNNVDTLKNWESQYQATLRSLSESKGEDESKSEEEPKTKKIKLENPSSEPDTETAPVSIFLAHGFRDGLKKLCEAAETPSELIKFLQDNEFLYKEDPIYEPPRDDNISSSTTGSLLDLGTDALSSLPKEQAIEGLQAYDKIRSKLREFFRPFAQEGKMVTEEEVREFFGKVQNEKD